MLKEIFRKGVVFFALYGIFAYFIELPLTFMNYHKLIEAQIESMPSNAQVSVETLTSIFWSITTVWWIVDAGFIIALFIFFTRPAVKQQFMAVETITEKGS